MWWMMRGNGQCKVKLGSLNRYYRDQTKAIMDSRNIIQFRSSIYEDSVAWFVENSDARRLREKYGNNLMI